MTSGPFINFHQSERMFHILRSEEFMECTITRSESSSKWQDARDFQLAVQKTCQVSDVEKLFPEQFKTVKTFITVIGLLLSLQTGFERSLVFSPRRILSQVKVLMRSRSVLSKFHLCFASFKNRYISYGNLVSQQAR